MKKLLFSLALALTVSGTALALDNIVLDNFENGLVNFTTEIHGNPPASMNYTVVDNPVKTGINTSNKVWKWTRNDIAPDNVNWAGFWAVLTNAVPTGYHRVEVKYLRTNATSQLRMKCEGAINKEFDPVKPASKTNEWETIVFDIYANGIKNINVLSLFPDNYTPVDLNSIVYIDDITVIFDPTIVPPVIPTLLTLFDNSASDRFHDQSWVNQTAPSTVATENWEAPGMANGDKLPCVTTPVKAGANALKLQWKSATGGDWMALAASVGWRVFDLKTMTHLKLWVNSPVALAKTAMPKIHFEAHSGNPNATGKVELANYLTADLAANTWTEITVPLADIWATNALFIAKDLIKGIFFSQSAIDNVQHTLYIDEITFVTITPPQTFFSNSANDRFHDQSWINQTAPSTVATENWEAPGMANGDKFPCVTTPVKAGANALKLEWKSVTAGNWMAMTAAVGWTSFDLTGMTHLKFWVNSPAVLAKTALPKLNLEAHSGNPNATGKIDMANYLSANIPANTWTEVTIPLADFWATNPLFLSQGVIKGLFFSQNATDNTLHTMYLDEFTFVKLLSGVDNPTIEKLNAYYANGEVRIANYVGNVRIFDLAGKTVANGKITDGKFRLTIQPGIYIVNTSKGNTKIAVQ